MRLIDADVVYKVLTDYYHHRTETQHESLKEALSKVPTVDVELVQPIEEFEWCHDCKEYDQNAHCCHRWTKVIRNTVNDLKTQGYEIVRHGHWEWDGYVYDMLWRCSECSCLNENDSDYCPNCGAKMNGERKDDEPTVWVMDKESHRCLTFPKEKETLIKHGHWINISISVTGNSSAECSRCGAVVHDSFSNAINYCPNCGAKMDEVEELIEIRKLPWCPNVMKELGYEPVRHGRWINHISENGATDGRYCGICDYEVDRDAKYNYCPNCGADMREVDNADN